MNTTHQGALHQQVTGFILRLQQQPKIDVSAVLNELTDTAVRLLSPVEYAGITTSVKGKVTTQAATGPVPVELDRIQSRYGDGPCLSAARNEEVVRVDDIQHDSRWPGYCDAAIERTPVRSVLSMALITDSASKSALNVYAKKPHAFDVGITETALMYAAYSSMAWTIARRDDQFQQALASRDVIGQAKGMIMERFSIDADQAFGLLKRLSQSSNTPLTQVATQLVEAEVGKPRFAQGQT